MNNFIDQDIIFFHILLLSLCLNIFLILKWTSKSRYLKNKKALSDSKDKYQGLVESLLEGIGIVDEKKKWHPIADYLTENTDIKFSHSVCPDCKDEIYGPGKKSKNGRREYNIED
ncbi:MAG: hypothetical protein GQ534_06265 [Candidatus Delongbacteria bacterium]|nr:hypothetical protein [Candidatus Delongbacteria bacterium]